MNPTAKRIQEKLESSCSRSGEAAELLLLLSDAQDEILRLERVAKLSFKRNDRVKILHLNRTGTIVSDSFKTEADGICYRVRLDWDRADGGFVTVPEGCLENV